MKPISGLFKMVKVEEGTSFETLKEISFDLGMMAFSPDRMVSLNQRSGGNPLFSYLGKAKISGSELSIETLACSVSELQGTEMRRTIASHTDRHLVLTGVGKKSKVAFRITWERVF